MPDIKPFFSVNAWGDSLTTGATLKIVHSLNYSDYTASPHMAPLVELPAAELQEKLEGSKAAEKAIFEKLKAATDEWEAQAAQTLLLEKVLEYVCTPEVSHTSNEWKQIQGGAWEISNRVYQMRYKTHLQRPECPQNQRASYMPEYPQVLLAAEAYKRCCPASCHRLRPRGACPHSAGHRAPGAPAG